jgi:transposase
VKGVPGGVSLRGDLGVGEGHAPPGSIRCKAPWDAAHLNELHLLLPVQRWCMTLRSIKPLETVPYCFENFKVYGAVAPTTGERFFLALPQLNTTTFQIFLREFSRRDHDTLNIVLMDNGSCHTAKSLGTPDNVGCLFILPYRPELNPSERLWRDMKDPWAWLRVAQIEEVVHQVERISRQYSKSAIQSLTSYAYFVQAVHALPS